MTLEQQIRPSKPVFRAQQQQQISFQTLEDERIAFLSDCRLRQLSPGTLTDYGDKLQSFVQWCSSAGVRGISEVSPNHIRAYLGEVQQRVSPATLHGHYRVLKVFFRWQMAEGDIERYPLSNIRGPKVPKTMIRPYREEELSRLLICCDQKTFLGSRNRALILTMVDSGLRRAEMARIKLSDIDVQHGLIKVNGKGNKERYAAIGMTARRAVFHYLRKRSQKKDECPFLWVTEEHRQLMIHSFWHIVKTTGQRAGIDENGIKSWLHTFRRTFATNAIRNGANLFQIQELMGHSSLEMTKVYARFLDSEHAAERHHDFSPVDRMGLK